MRPALAVSAVTITVLLAGCCVRVGSVSAGVACRNTARVDNSVLVLLAQSVPTAQLIPCIASVPAGWRPAGLHVTNGRASFVVGSDRDGPKALTVALTRACRITGATAVPSDVAGARRYERPRQVGHGYAGDRYYVYAGGCTTYTFDLTGQSRAVPVTEVAQAIRFVQRTEVADLVRRMNDGRVVLDPTPERSPT
jgi:hypothetical protein